jgi:predicted anti-sigma-YlaC factor YlaD
MAAMALLDGEAAPLAAVEINAHVANCDVCGAALAGLTSLNVTMARVSYHQQGVDLWPSIRASVARPQRQAAREMTAIVGLAIALGGWRLAQLLVDLPAPVVNSTVPLALVVAVLWRFVGDPFAIQVSSHRLQGDQS